MFEVSCVMCVNVRTYMVYALHSYTKICVLKYMFEYMYACICAYNFKDTREAFGWMGVFVAYSVKHVKHGRSCVLEGLHLPRTGIASQIRPRACGKRFKKVT